MNIGERKKNLKSHVIENQFKDRNLISTIIKVKEYYLYSLF